MTNKLTTELTNTRKDSHSWKILTHAVQNFRAFYWTQRFSTVFTRTSSSFRPSARSVQSTKSRL